jgi:hypothetical protein
MPPAVTGEAASAYREELGRLGRVTLYLRVVFSVLMLSFAAFGPGILLRFPFAGAPLALGPMNRFFAFRPGIFALLFVALACVLAALVRRALAIFRELVRLDCRNGERGDYIRFLRPPLFPFVLSGNTVIDTLVFVVMLAAYGFWVVVLVETTPVVLLGYQTAGVVLGSYGLFAAAIVTAYVWFDARRRSRAITSAGTGTADRVSATR